MTRDREKTGRWPSFARRFPLVFILASTIMACTAPATSGSRKLSSLANTEPKIAVVPIPPRVLIASVLGGLQSMDRELIHDRITNPLPERAILASDGQPISTFVVEYPLSECAARPGSFPNNQWLDKCLPGRRYRTYGIVGQPVNSARQSIPIPASEKEKIQYSVDEILNYLSRIGFKTYNSSKDLDNTPSHFPSESDRLVAEKGYVMVFISYPSSVDISIQSDFGLTIYIIEK
jgi:hypothetical protein